MEETVEVLEAAQKEDLLPEIIRSEVNSLIYPIFALHTKDLDKIKEIEYKSTVRRNGQKLEVVWSVSSNPKFGFPGPFEKQIHRAVERIINLLPLPIKNPIILGSLGSVARFAGLKHDKKGKFPGHVYKDIHDAFIKNKMTGIVSKGTFYHKGKEQWIEDYFNLYERVIFKGEKLPDGTVADTNYLFLSSWYLESINARYVRPLNYSYLEKLNTELTRRFYELFGSKFYFILQNNVPYIRYKYSTLCQLLPVVPQKHYSKALERLDPSHKQLIETGFFEKISWPKSKISKNPADWFIYYYPGERAKEEYQKYRDGYQISDGDLVQLVETNIAESAQLESKKSQTKALNKSKQPLLNQLIIFGITQKIAEEIIKEQKPKIITQWLEAIEVIPNLTDKSAYLAKALKENWALPELYKNRKKQEESLKATQTQQEKEKKEKEEKLQQELREKEELSALYHALNKKQKEQFSGLVEEEFKKFYCPTRDPASPIYQSLLETAKYNVLRNLKENQAKLSTP